MAHRREAGPLWPAGGADEDADDAPGARSKAAYGTLPKQKLGSTSDSSSKGPRFVQEAPESFARRQEACVQPEQSLEEEYVELPSPLPSREAYD